MGKRFYLALVLLLVPLMILTACDGGGTTTTTSSTSTTTTTTTTTPPVFTLTSNSFANGGVIPVQYSWSGGNKSPHFSWSGAPEGTVSFVLIVDDTDAGVEPNFFCHWIVFNIPASVFELAENQPATATLANGAMQGMNNFGTIGYGGPAPPPGEVHHYRFRLYALDTLLDLTSAAVLHDILEAIDGHILGQVNYTGTYTSIG
jgi:Raf kinase inhibitor-like YbhB/YbcL family protein